jgi:type VII secretion-associated serine protease mycosin
VGLTGPVSQVLADAPSTGPVRITTLAEDAAGRPRVTVTTAVDRGHAAAAVRIARAIPNAVAVAVDHRVGVADVGTPIPLTEAAADSPAPLRAAGLAAASNDTYRSQQWALDKLRAETVWGLQRGTGQTVAVVDTGVDGTHPDLAGRLLPGVDYVDAGGDGRTDPNGHGTHVAGIIGAIAGNGLGVAGLADGASILPVRVLDADGGGWTSDVASGVTWAVDHGATVINMSLAGPDDDPILASAISYAQSHDVVVVAAAGNDRAAGDPVEYPAADPGVVAVAATDSANRSASFSEEGSYVGIAAPGVSIASTYPVALGSYALMSGTSMASPYAAATAALLRAAAPSLSASDVIGAMAAAADDLGPSGRDVEFGYGLIDPVNALQSVRGGALPAAPDAPAAPVARPGNGSATVSWSRPAAHLSPITRYTVTARPGGRTATTSGATAAIVTGLTNGVSYTFTVTATNAHGTSAASSASAAVRPDDPITRYVIRVYQDLLDRSPDARGLASWTASLEHGTPYGQVANAITNSSEFRGGLIRDAYAHYLGRNPDPDGMRHWLQAMATGMHIEQMEDGFIASPEFYAKAGSARAWVAHLYQTVLNRSPSSAEVDGWVAQLRAGKSRTFIANGFLLSTEHLTTVVNGYYQQLLRRNIDPSGARSWVSAIQRGARDEQIIAGIVASREYRLRS